MKLIFLEFKLIYRHTTRTKFQTKQIKTNFNYDIITIKILLAYTTILNNSLKRTNYLTHKTN